MLDWAAGKQVGEVASAAPGEKKADLLDGKVIVDAGDALSDSPMLPAERLENARKTAEFIVARFRVEGVKAQLIGDRDIGLGRSFLADLAKRAGYPLLATNLIDADTREAVFERTALVELGGIKVGFLGLLATSAGRSDSFAQEKLALAPLVPAAQEAVASLRKQGADLIVALSQLTPSDEEMVANGVPEIQLFLGGDLPESREEPKAVGKSFSIAGGQKGKQLALVTLLLDDPAGAGAPFSDPGQREAARRKMDEARQRIASYEQLLKELAAQPRSPVDGSSQVQPGRPQAEAYERQLAAARAELALAEEALSTAPAADREKRANTFRVQLVQLGRTVMDEPDVLKSVQDFRKSWPDPTPGH